MRFPSPASLGEGEVIYYNGLNLVDSGGPAGAGRICRRLQGAIADCKATIRATSHCGLLSITQTLGRPLGFGGEIDRHALCLNKN